MRMLSTNAKIRKAIGATASNVVTPKGLVHARTRVNAATTRPTMRTQDRSVTAVRSENNAVTTNRTLSAKSSTSVSVCAIVGDGSGIAASASGGRLVATTATAKRSPLGRSHRLV